MMWFFLGTLSYLLRQLRIALNPDKYAGSLDDVNAWLKSVDGVPMTRNYFEVLTALVHVALGPFALVRGLWCWLKKGY